jgi:hypothetical protein
MVPFSEKTRETYAKCTPHAHTRALVFRFLLYWRSITWDLGLWRGERDRGVLTLHLFLFFFSSAFIFIHPRLSHARTEDRLARLRAVQSSFVMEISLRADPGKYAEHAAPWVIEPSL